MFLGQWIPPDNVKDFEVFFSISVNNPPGVISDYFQSFTALEHGNKIKYLTSKLSS